MSATEGTGIPAWPAASPARFVDDLFRWIERTGSTRYDEAVTQLEHALQTAYLAVRAGDTDFAVAAALLHDVGHLLLCEHERQDEFLHADLEHEAVGARWLSRMFPPEVSDPVRGHVDAKRYLCAVDAEYAGRLSAASTRSLALQGGPMTPGECEAALRRPGFGAAIALRRRDEGGKVADRVVPGLDGYRALIESVLTT